MKAKVTLDAFNGTWKPVEYVVYCYVQPTKRNGLTVSLINRVGGYKTTEEARASIADDKKAMQRTFGGLIDAVGVDGRYYRIFKATWEPVL